MAEYECTVIVSVTDDAAEEFEEKAGGKVANTVPRLFFSTKGTPRTAEPVVTEVAGGDVNTTYLVTGITSVERTK